MYYLVIGKENINSTTFKYYFEGSFTSDELKIKAKESYYSEYEINIDGVTVSKESGSLPTEEGTFNFGFWYVFQSEKPIVHVS